MPTRSPHHPPATAFAAAAAFALLALGVAGCGGGGADPDATTSGGGQSALVNSVMLADMPAAHVGVGAAKENATEGDQVVLMGVIGGSRSPITEGAPVFTIVDRTLDNCADIPGDNCPVPWDYCCEPKDSLIAHTATIKVVNDAGDLLSIDAAALGLSPNDEVVIVGTVAPRPFAEQLTVNATGVHRIGTLRSRAGNGAG